MELIKNNYLVPGKDIFFYRDQNGVEIDFIVERKGKLTFIEAKSNEKLDKNKLNFKKVLPLFPDREVKAVATTRSNSDYLIEFKDFNVINPLKNLIL